MADWDSYYTTLLPDYQTAQLDVFYKIYEKVRPSCLPGWLLAFLVFRFTVCCTDTGDSKTFRQGVGDAHACGLIFVISWRLDI